MGRKQVLNAYLTMSAGDMSGDVESEVTDTRQLDVVTYEYQWLGVAPIGILYVETSNDYDPNNPSVATWHDLDPNNVQNLTDNSGKGKIDVEFCTMKYTRTRYARTSGSGTLNAWVSGTTRGA